MGRKERRMKEFTVYLPNGTSVTIVAERVERFDNGLYFYRNDNRIAMFVIDNISGWAERRCE